MQACYFGIKNKHIHNQQQLPELQMSQQMKADQKFCLSWLKNNYELMNGSSIEKQDMYEHYLNSVTLVDKFGLKSFFSEQQFAVCVRSVTLLEVGM